MNPNPLSNHPISRGLVLAKKRMALLKVKFATLFIINDNRKRKDLWGVVWQTYRHSTLKQEYRLTKTTLYKDTILRSTVVVFILCFCLIISNNFTSIAPINLWEMIIFLTLLISEWLFILRLRKLFSYSIKTRYLHIERAKNVNINNINKPLSNKHNQMMRYLLFIQELKIKKITPEQIKKLLLVIENHDNYLSFPNNRFVIPIALLVAIVASGIMALNADIKPWQVLSSGALLFALYFLKDMIPTQAKQIKELKYFMVLYAQD